VDSRRAESFSDGVFAVAITVLVFNLLPIADETSPGGGKLALTGAYLGHHWPAYLAYVVSFLTIGIMWLNHHTMFSQVTKVDRPVLVLNLLLLMGIVAIPFPTALVADHLTGSSGGTQASLAAVVYGLVMIVISIGYASVWMYLAAHQEALGARRRVHRPRFSTFRFTAGNAGYVAGTLIAVVSPVAALIIFGLLAIYYMIEHLPSEPVEGDDAAEPSRATERS
jgi:TMEM175 potassium channel family protein